MEKYIGILIGGIHGSAFGTVGFFLGALIGYIIVSFVLTPNLRTSTKRVEPYISFTISRELDNSFRVSNTNNSANRMPKICSMMDADITDGLYSTDINHDDIFDSGTEDTNDDDINSTFDIESDDVFSTYPDDDIYNTINPANGMPMVCGIGSIDILGNQYGTDNDNDDIFGNEIDDVFNTNTSDIFDSVTDDIFDNGIDDIFSTGADDTFDTCVNSDDW